jgi:hypothetical protein
MVDQEHSVFLIFLGLTRGSKPSKIQKRVGQEGLDLLNAAMAAFVGIGHPVVDTGTIRNPKAVTIPRLCATFPWISWDFLEKGHDWVVPVPTGNILLAPLRANYVASCLEPGTVATFLSLKVLVWSGVRLSDVIGADTDKTDDQVEESTWTFVKTSFSSPAFILNKTKMIRKVQFDQRLTMDCAWGLDEWRPKPDQYRTIVRSMIRSAPEPLAKKWQANLDVFDQEWPGIENTVYQEGYEHQVENRF